MALVGPAVLAAVGIVVGAIVGAAGVSVGSEGMGQTLIGDTVAAGPLGITGDSVGPKLLEIGDIV